MEIDRTLIDLTGNLITQHPLHAYDAIQLAAAVRLHVSLAVIIKFA
jgi:hypothetical protein